jgi:hypothetical protein
MGRGIATESRFDRFGLTVCGKGAFGGDHRVDGFGGGGSRDQERGGEQDETVHGYPLAAMACTGGRGPQCRFGGRSDSVDRLPGAFKAARPGRASSHNCVRGPG